MAEIRPSDISPEGLDPLAGFLRGMFAEAAHLSAGYLRWLYRGNPDGATLAFDAWEGRFLAAHLAASPLRARVFGEEERGLLIHHAATDPRWSGRGLFKGLVEQALRAGEEAGCSFAIAVANANSVFGFCERLGFALVGSLDARLGVGPTPASAPGGPLDFARVWSPEALRWRLGRPGRSYRFRAMGEEARVYADSGTLGIQVELGGAPRSLAEELLPELSVRRPLRIWIGLDPHRRWGLRPYLSLPRRLRPSPLHLVARDLLGRERPFRREGFRFDALDFDAY